MKQKTVRKVRRSEESQMPAQDQEIVAKRGDKKLRFGGGLSFQSCVRQGEFCLGLN